MADLDDLLERTSRTFALAVPLLPEPTRREVTIAYLLFRIADTFEDAFHWAPAKRVEALGRFAGLLQGYSRSEAERLSAAWTADGPSAHRGYRDLVAETPFVLDAWQGLAPEATRHLGEHVIRSADGMARFVSKTDDRGQLRLGSIPELQDYCYVVAGIVGEMLTELFLLDRPNLAPAAPFLRERARAFGEALQLVNILKDSEGDAVEGRTYVPETVDRAEVFALARRDLETAGAYIRALQEAGAPRGVLAFTALPVQLAWASLEKIEARGAGAKVSRPEVFVIKQRLERALDRNEPLAPLPAELSRRP